MLAQVGPSWPQDASMLAQNPRKSPEHTSQGLRKAKSPRFLIQNCSFWNSQNLENNEKNICFIGPFAICTFLLLLMLVWVSKLAQVRSKLAYLSKLESKLNQFGMNLAQDASILSQVGLRKKAFLNEEKTC